MKKRILTGDRTTGKLHLGHYVGSLQNRVRLQEKYDTFILLADVQALTTHFKNPELINESIYNVAIDNLSVGLDPRKITFIQQSQIPSIAELTIFYSMLVSVNSLRHNPTIKTEAKQYGYDEMSYGFLGYPVSQAADISFCDADLVPVGEDQLPHIEQARKIIRRFNDLYGNGQAIIKIPEALLSSVPRLVGLDGNSKMGKSLGNAVFLSDSSDTVATKIKAAITDTNRITLSVKGNPDICIVSQYHKVFNPDEHINICDMCRNAQIGCVACKRNLYEKINSILDPFREKRAYYEQNKEIVRELILTGSKKANKIGNKKIQHVKEVMKIII
ncbi:MAG: tryptophan--tRNA ligase [Saccharofermentanales bacterium]